jgi:hypothetical protein
MFSELHRLNGCENLTGGTASFVCHQCQNDASDQLMVTWAFFKRWSLPVGEVNREMKKKKMIRKTCHCQPLYRWNIQKLADFHDVQPGEEKSLPPFDSSSFCAMIVT